MKRLYQNTEKEQLTKENNTEETITEEDNEQETSIEAADTTDNNAAVKPAYSDKEGVELDPSWQYAGNAVITTGNAVYYKSSSERKGITVAVNAGHGYSRWHNSKNILSSGWFT